MLRLSDNQTLAEKLWNWWQDSRSFHHPIHLSPFLLWLIYLTVCLKRRLPVRALQFHSCWNRICSKYSWPWLTELGTKSVFQDAKIILKNLLLQRWGHKELKWMEWRAPQLLMVCPQLWGDPSQQNLHEYEDDCCMMLPDIFCGIAFLVNRVTKCSNCIICAQKERKDALLQGAAPYLQNWKRESRRIL